MQRALKRVTDKLPIIRCSYQGINEASNRNYRRNEYNYGPRKFSKYVLGAATTIGFLGFNLNEKVYTESNDNETSAGVAKEGFPFFSMDEVSKHTSIESRIWVTYKEGVYDITDFIKGHPGGDQILIAAGSSVEPFWMLYGIHKNPHVFRILESYRIGNLHKEEVDELTITKNMSDPYNTDPRRHAALKPASTKPFNAESPPSLLVESFITPNELFYVRNHLPVPDINPEEYQLEVELEGINKTSSFTLDELKRMPKKTITATIMCAGNRRSEMSKVKPVKGLNWGPAAVGNATWTGVPLRDILKKAGLNEDDERYAHVQFEAEDVDATGKTYTELPFQSGKQWTKRGDVLLAYEMNGVPIPRDHGYPIRLIVPGVVGARNVKWLGKIIVSEKESDSHWQKNDYKGFSPTTDWDSVDFAKSPPIQELPIISAICKPNLGETVQVVNGSILVKGYAWSGGGQRIIRVDVTADGGKTWHVASFNHQDTALPPQHWSWTLWSVTIPVDQKLKNVEIWAKAVDSCYNTQPESFENIWNLRGVLNNAYHRIKVNLKH